MSPLDYIQLFSNRNKHFLLFKLNAIVIFIFDCWMQLKEKWGKKVEELIFCKPCKNFPQCAAWMCCILDSSSAEMTLVAKLRTARFFTQQSAKIAPRVAPSKVYTLYQFLSLSKMCFLNFHHWNFSPRLMLRQCIQKNMS